MLRADFKLFEDHCLEHLRQTLMCNADLRPIPMEDFIREEDGRRLEYVPMYTTEHACRDWDEIWDWAWQRNTTRMLIENQWIPLDEEG